jgi:hypothetical protein
LEGTCCPQVSGRGCGQQKMKLWTCIQHTQVLQLLQEALKQQAAGQGRAIHLSPHSTASIGIQGSALPASLIPKGLQPHEYEPAQGGQPGTNLLILLHGLGDKPQPYAALARRMALPQVLNIPLSVVI